MYCTDFYRYKLIYKKSAHSRKSFPKRFVCLFALLLTAFCTLRAQTAYDLEPGFYYLENKQNNNNGYYLVPAAGTGKIRIFSGNEETPYLTTYTKSKETTAEAQNNFIWYIEKEVEGGQTYYRFRHVLTGRYVVMNPAEDAGNPVRRRFHVEAMSTPGDNARFQMFLSNDGNRVGIRHASYYATHTDGMVYWWWDISDGNQGNYSQGDYKGLLGVWWQQGDASGRNVWAKPVEATEAVCLPPDIVYDGSQVSISSPDGLADVTFHYTTDGTEPTATSPTYSGPFAMPAGQKVVKAIAVRAGGFQNPTVTTYNIDRCATPTITFDDATGLHTLSCATEGVVFYYTTDGSMPTTASASNTTGALALPLDLGQYADQLRVVAVKAGEEATVSAPAIYYLPGCAAPTISQTNDLITIASATDGASLRYTTNNANVTSTSIAYTGPYSYPLIQASHTINARAFKQGYCRSAQTSYSYPKLATPELVKVAADGTLTLTPSGATFRFTTSTTSTAPSDPKFESAESLTLPPDAGIEVVKVRAYKAGYGYSDVLTYYLPACMAPTFSQEGSTVTIGAAEGDIVYYSTGGDFVLYSGPFEKITAVVKAYAAHAGYRNSPMAQLRDAVVVSSTSQMTDMEGSYRLGADFVVESPIGTSDHPFTGTIDGQLTALTQPLTKPIVAYAKDATLCNIVVGKAQVNGSGNIGALACEATGFTRIYNCGLLSGSVSGTDMVGGLVGKLDGEARVVNCYSFADVAGGSEVAGIVGHNNVASTQNNIKTMVMNCMFYGNITGGTNRYPVYGGSLVANNANTGINNYNYYRDEASLGTLTDYNCSWPAEEKHLTRFEYFRSVLNSNRELCAWWISGTTAGTGLVAKWVLDPEVAPYPILKPWGRYASPVNRDQSRVWHPDGEGHGHWVDRDDAAPYEGHRMGNLTVTVKTGTQGGGLSKTLTLPITDMDTLDHDFGYCKVQLPYYNTTFGNPDAADWTSRYAGNYSDNKVVTGWKVTAVTGGTQGTFVSDRNAANAYNFADRLCTDKDLFSVSGRVFAQGGFYYVPEGVTAIEIEAYWGTAIYLQNKEHYIDVVNLTSNNGGQGFVPAGKHPATFNGQTVYAKMADAVNASGTTGTVYDYAIVLLGNVQHYNSTSNDMYVSNHCYTLMSTDLDFDDEPDHCLQLEVGNGSTQAPLAGIRMDFLTVADLGLAVKRHGTQIRYAISCLILYGHFEVTETAQMTTTEFRYEDGYHKPKAGVPMIINGGQFPEEFVSSNSSGTAEGTLYFIAGGNATFHTLALSSHNKYDCKNRHVPISIMGGEYNEVSLSGILKDFAVSKVYKDNPQLYTNGGRFHIVRGAGMEAVNGDVSFRIDHSIIDEFYGGGQHAVNVINGDIDIQISNSLIGFYCGGPMVGNMPDGKKITTRAVNTVFGRYFGAGNGGTAYSLDASKNKDDAGSQRSSKASDWWMGSNEYVPLTHIMSGSTDLGFQAKFKFQIWNMPSGTVANHPSRRYIYNAQFAATTTHDIFNYLDGCHVLGDFYGAGNLGAVDGDVTSVLTDCTVDGSAFGGGYSASIPTVWVYTLNDISYPWRDANTGLCHQAIVRDSVLYTWTNTQPTTPIATATRGTEAVNYLNTSVPLLNLGTVSGKCTLTIKGNSLVRQSVYGGGNESKVGDTEVHLSGNTDVRGDLFGGGNKGDVVRSTNVVIDP